MLFQSYPQYAVSIIRNGVSMIYLYRKEQVSFGTEDAKWQTLALPQALIIGACVYKLEISSSSTHAIVWLFGHVNAENFKYLKKLKHWHRLNG